MSGWVPKSSNRRPPVPGAGSPTSATLFRTTWPAAGAVDAATTSRRALAEIRAGSNNRRVIFHLHENVSASQGFEPVGCSPTVRRCLTLGHRFNRRHGRFTST